MTNAANAKACPTMSFNLRIDLGYLSVGRIPSG
jgi:hypothetical protein